MTKSAKHRVLKKNTAPAPTRRDDRLRRMQRLVIQGELAATAVHEISNLQTIVLFNAGFLREQHKGNPAILNYVEPLLHAATMIATLCGQLRNLAHPIETTAQLVDLAEITAGSYRLLDRIISRELSFERTQPGPLLIVADPSQIEQMLINLVLNSRDATPDEGGRIVVRVGRRAGRPWLEVEDNGTGMSEAVKAKVFTKFFTTKEPGRGTGLGLVTLRRLVEAIGGRVELRSRVGRGTRIRLSFPAPNAALQAMPPLTTPAQVHPISANLFHDKIIPPTSGVETQFQQFAR